MSPNDSGRWGFVSSVGFFGKAELMLSLRNSANCAASSGGNIGELLLDVSMVGFPESVLSESDMVFGFVQVQEDEKGYGR